MSTPVETEEDIRELTPESNIPPSALIAYQILEALKDNDDAAYKVWLKLSNKFGAGQKI